MCMCMLRPDNALLQLALVLLFHSATSAASPLAHVVVSPLAPCTGGAIYISI